MRYLHLTVAAAVLLSTAWAQQRRTVHLRYKPHLEEKLRQSLRLLPEEGLAQPVRAPHLRTQGNILNLTWLRPSQDADTLPSDNTLPAFDGRPEYAGDTLLANNIGTDIDPTLSDDCNHSFFDSLAAVGFVWVSRYWGPFVEIVDPDEPEDYFGGGVAERYDFDLANLTPGNSIYIKGIALYIRKYRPEAGSWHPLPDGCNFLSAEPTDPDVPDGAFTFIYQLRDTIGGTIAVRDPSDVRPLIYPGDTLRQTVRKANEVRLAVNATQDQCRPASMMQPILERYDVQYFDIPFEVSESHSYFIVFRGELINPVAGDQLFDTVITIAGPNYNDNSHPCTSSDTNIVARRYVLNPQFDPQTEVWADKDNWYPLVVYPEPKFIANFLMHPVIWEGPSGLVTGGGAVVRSGDQAFSTPYPNPAVECLSLRLTTPAEAKATFMLYTSTGELVQEWDRRVPAGESVVSLDLPSVPAGSYILNARTPYGIASFWVNVVK